MRKLARVSAEPRLPMRTKHHNATCRIRTSLHTFDQYQLAPVSFMLTIYAAGGWKEYHWHVAVDRWYSARRHSEPSRLVEAWAQRQINLL
jgi:hypothetical protein